MKDLPFLSRFFFFTYSRHPDPPDPRKITNTTSSVNPAELPRFGIVGRRRIDHRSIPHEVEQGHGTRARYFTVQQEVSVR